ncbi:uncharacterized protein [Rutidosis leptorrhynchoides]|uniref:uncharacterized protein n=1 Tax=Rutidosis leptorrhynchoides TaxID=125765 RepID=UPI003A9967B3
MNRIIVCPDSNLNSPKNPPEEGEIIVGEEDLNYATPTKSFGNGNNSKGIHYSLEKVTSAVKTQKEIVDGIKNSIFTSNGKDKKDNRYWIATVLRYIPSNQIVLIVNVYAPHNVLCKILVWDQLYTIASRWPGPICFLGDFNSVCCPEERFRETIDWSCINGFNEFISKASLFDQHLNNEEFTWEGPLDLAAFKKSKKKISIQAESKRRLHSRFQWLRLGDKNTRFFHLVSKIRQQSSYISGMQIQDVWEDRPEVVKEHTVVYFEKMFCRSVSCLLADTVFDWASLNLAKVSAHQNILLEAQFTPAEIERVVKYFDGNKTLGPDGFTMRFFQKSWFWLEDIIMDMFSQFYDNPSFPKGFNSPFIVLIPKSNSARCIEHLRPITLLNAPYKIIAKTLANRLKLAIPSIISESQNGFVPSRLLMDGVIVVNEVVHMAKKKKKPILLLKIDFSKAYDCVSHEFLLQVLLNMGFVSKFILWIKTCISHINFSVLLNGSPSREGVMHQGLSQGDPLSSFLFIIVAKILSKLLSNDLDNGLLKGCQFNQDLCINHSQFADDTIIFAQPSIIELNRIKSILHLFFQASGLEMNLVKTTLYGRCLSFGGRLVLVKEVISNLPLHYMSIYKAPVGIIKRLERYQRNFLWGGDCLKKKTSLVKWDSFRLPCSPLFSQTGWDLMLPQPLLLYDHLKALEIHTLLASFKVYENEVDMVVWPRGLHGEYTVAEAIRIIMVSSNNVIPNWPVVVWNNKVPSKIALFHWLTLKKGIPVRDVLVRRYILLDTQSTVCVWCLVDVESIEHLLMHCSWSYKIWSDLFQWWNLCWVLPVTVNEFSFDWYYGMGINDKRFWRMIGPATLWAIWVARNDYIFNANEAGHLHVNCLLSAVGDHRCGCAQPPRTYQLIIKLAIGLWQVEYG